MLVMIEGSNMDLSLTPESGQRMVIDEWPHSFLGSPIRRILCKTLSQLRNSEHLRDATSVFDLTDVVLAAIAIDA